MSAPEFYFDQIEQVAFGCALDIHTECIYRLEGYIHETYRNKGQDAEKIWTFHLKDGRPTDLISTSSAEDLRKIINKERKSPAYRTIVNEFLFNPIESVQAGVSLNRQLESVYRLDGYFSEPFRDKSHKEYIKNWQITGPDSVLLPQKYRCTVEEMRERIVEERGGR